MKSSLAFSLLLCFTFTASKAQDLYNGTGLYVTGGVLHVPGSIMNEGYLQNNGTVTLEGDWKNQRTYNGSGTVVLQGAQTQHVLNHNQPMAQLHVLGAGQKRIGDELTLTKALILEAGIIHFYNHGKLQLLREAKIEGGSPESFINGPLTHEGTGYKFYPVGKNNYYRPMELLDVHGIAPVTSIELMENAPSLTVPLCDQIFGKFYWQRTTVSGTFQSSPLAVTFSQDDVTHQQRLVIIEADGFDSDFTPLEINGITDSGRGGKISSEDAATGSLFLLASRQLLQEKQEPEYYFSNILSPAASNPVNRSVKVFGDFLMQEDFHFVIFNRSGLVVFETRSLDAMKETGWNGEVNGAGLPAGAYPYAFHAVTKSGESKDLKGIISIVR